jgi:hypothetical protein
MATFSLWEGAECGISLVRGAGPPTCANGELMDPGTTLVKAFEAASWNEACQVQHDHYGWGRYEPSDTWEEIGPPRAQQRGPGRTKSPP